MYLFDKNTYYRYILCFYLTDTCDLKCGRGGELVKGDCRCKCIRKWLTDKCGRSAFHPPGQSSRLG